MSFCIFGNVEDADASPEGQQVTKSQVDDFLQTIAVKPIFFDRSDQIKNQPTPNDTRRCTRVVGPNGTLPSSPYCPNNLSGFAAENRTNCKKLTRSTCMDSLGASSSGGLRPSHAAINAQPRQLAVQTLSAQIVGTGIFVSLLFPVVTNPA